VNYPSTDTRQTYCWTPTAGCTNVVSDNPATTVYPFGVASKFQWDIPMDVLGVQGTPQSTVGNNVDEALLWSGGGRSYNNPANPRPISATRDYTAGSFPFTNQWFNTACNPAPLIATGQAGAQANPNVEDWSAATINLFVGHNRLHDYAYYLGWDEGHWNAQQYNNGINTVDPSPPPATTPSWASPRTARSVAVRQATGPATTRTWEPVPTDSTRRPTCSSGSRFRVPSTPPASTATTTSPSSRTSSAMPSRTAWRAKASEPGRASPPARWARPSAT
jgi:hypothetical protein